MSRPGWLRFLVSLPERLIRSLIAALAGFAHEAAALLLPRLIRRSRLYEATAKNMLRVAIELVGGVEGASSVEPREPPADELAKRKTVGNAVELGSIAAFGFSPLWLVAAVSDISRGSRVYLDALVGELKGAGVLAEGVEVESVDELLSVLERSSGHSARLIDIPPLELAELRASIAELRSDVGSLPSREELRVVYDGLRRTAEREGRPLLEVSSGIGLAFLLSARDLTRTHLVVPYREDWQPVRREGFASYAGRVSGPYVRAIGGHFDPQRSTWTERLMSRLSRDA